MKTIEQEAYPLSWPIGWDRTRDSLRTRGNFKGATVSSGKNEILREVRLLHVSEYVISTNIPTRRDGLPYSNQRQPKDPGVALYFVRKGKKLVLACDKWNTVEANMRAIAKHIDSIRGQDRWGVGTVERAFTAYAALPAQGETGKSCWAILDLDAGVATEADVKKAFNARAQLAHPDKGGTTAQLDELMFARDEALRLIKENP